MATNGFCDVCADGTQVVATFGVAEIRFAADPVITLPSFGMFTRAASGLSTQFAIVKLNTGGDALLINRAGATFDLGITYGNYCVALSVGTSVRAVWQSSATQYKFRLFNAALTPLGAATTVAIPSAFVGTSQGFLDLNANGTPIFTDSRRTLTVQGLPLIYPVTRGGYWIGQGGGTLGAQICGVAPNGRKFTLYQGESFEPHLAQGTGLFAATRTTANGAQFFTIDPNNLPGFVGGDGTVTPGGAGGAPTAGAGNGFVGQVGPPPLQQPVIDEQTKLLTKPWAKWAGDLTMSENTPVNFSDVAGAPPPPVGGTDPGAGPITGLTGDVLASGPGTVAATFRQGTADSVLGRSANSAGAIADIAAAADSTLFGRRSGALTFAKADLTAEVTGRLPYANLTAALAASELLGRTSASAGDWQDITLSTDLGMALTVLGLASDRLVLRFTDVTVTDAQIKALGTPTGLVLVAAQGANTRIVPIGMDCVADFTAGAYTNVNANGYLYGALANEETGRMTPIVNDVAASLTDLTAFLNTNAASKQRLWLAPAAKPVTAALASSFGTPVTTALVNIVTASSYNVGFNLIAFNSGSGAFTGGNAANTLKIRTYYLVQAF